MLSHDQIEQIELQAFYGVPSPLEDICKIYPLTFKQIVEMGNKYKNSLGLLLLTETEIFDMMKEKTGKEYPIEEIKPLEYLLLSSTYNDSFLLDLQDAFSTFIKEDILLLPKINSVLVGKPEDRRLINSTNFPILQDILRIQNKRDIKAAPPKDETPGERKMRLLKEKVEEVKRKKAQKNGEEQSILTLLEMAEVYGINTSEKSLFAVYNLVQRHQKKEKWEQDIQMLCAGADAKKIKTQYWGESSKK